MESNENALNSPEKRERASRAKNCAECRRLKIKCDRQIPCNNCVKRGTAKICPDGRLMAKGDRLILSNTEDLHAQIEELLDRIGSLEEALASLQAQHSEEPHPLLSGDPDEPLITSFGSLMIKEDGNTRFFGGTSSVEYMMAMGETHVYDAFPSSDPNQRSNEALHGPVADSLIGVLSTDFPLPGGSQELPQNAMMEKAIKELPPKDKALLIIDGYFMRSSWELCPIRRPEFIRDCFVPCYDRSSNHPVTLQDFGLLYAYFGVGMLHNVEISNSAATAARYISISRSCLTVGNFIINASLSTINALLMHALYFYSVDEPADPQKAWVLAGIAIKLATGLGLHREPSLWGLAEEEAAQRRRTMWELLSMDLWGALISGRPPMLSRQHFDVKLPFESPDGSEADPNFSRGKHHFSEACLWGVLDLRLASSNKATYAAVLKMDTKIRQWDLPRSMHAPEMKPMEHESTIVAFKEATVMIFKEITLLCLHRSYFAAAVLEPPFEPLKSHYSRSVLAAYGSSCAILSTVRNLYTREPIIMMRFSFFWSHAFTAAVTLASVTIRAPDCTLAPTALVEFDKALDLFRRAQAGYRAGRGLPILLRLHTQAHAAYDSYKSGTWTKPTTTDSSLQGGLGGSAPVTQHLRPNITPSPPTSSSTNNSLASPQHQNSSNTQTPDVMATLGAVQPSFEQYLSSYGLNSAHESTVSFMPSVNQSQAPQKGGPFRIGAAGGVDVGSSDEFLYGVLGSQWNNSSQMPMADQSNHPSFALGPSPDTHYPSQFTHYSMSSQDESGVQHLQQPQQAQYPQYNQFPSLPTSDSGSTGSGGYIHPQNPNAEGDVAFATSQLYQGDMSLNQPASEDSQASFLWDKFLRELGVQGNGT